MVGGAGRETVRGRALVVFESFFGNTEHAARAVAAGLNLEGWSAVVTDVAQVADTATADIDLLVVGAPTHAFSLSRRSTRAEAVQRGGRADDERIGLREWLEGLDPAPEPRPAAAFDTRVSRVRHVPASAARRAAHLLRMQNYRLVAPPHGFTVQGVEGPLDAHQTECAIAWGRSVAREAQLSLSALRLE